MCGQGPKPLTLSMNNISTAMPNLHACEVPFVCARYLCNAVSMVLGKGRYASGMCHLLTVESQVYNTLSLSGRVQLPHYEHAEGLRLLCGMLEVRPVVGSNLVAEG